MNTTRISSEEHISHLLLDKFISGSCTAEESCCIKKHCLECTECNEYLLLMTNKNIAITNEFPDYELLKDHSRKKGGFNFFKFPQYLIAQPLPVKFGFTSILLLSLITAFNVITNGRGNSQLSVKGTPQWVLYTNKTFFHGVNDSIVSSPNDTIQLLLNAQVPVYFALLYRDDQGGTKPYFLENKTPLMPSEDKKPVVLPFSIVLDSLWNEQTIYCIATPELLILDKAVALVMNDGHISNSPDIYFKKFLLHKK